MMQIAKYLVAAGLTVLWASCAWAGIYIAPLDGLKGVYSTGDLAPNLRETTFDFGTTFERIDSVRLRFSGTIAPALYRGNSTQQGPQADSQVIPDVIVELVRAHPEDSPGRLIGQWSVNGAFEAENALFWLPRFDPSTGDWITDPPAFLKGGQGKIQLYLGGVMPGEWSYQVIPALAGITSAYPVFDGVAATVPEPAGVLAMVVGGLIVILRRDGRR
jgi:hypothetical protein